MLDPPLPHDDARTWRRFARTGISLAVVVAIFVGALPKVADYGDVWSTIRGMTWFEVGTLVLVGLVNLATYWFVLTSALPGLRLREAAVVNQASTAVSNTLPAGGAIGVGVTVTMLNGWGFRLPAIGLQAVVSGVWNNFVKLGTPVLALVLLALQGDLTAPRVAAALVGIFVLIGAVFAFALVLRNDRFARAVGRTIGSLVDLVRRIARRPPVGVSEDAASRFRSETVDLLARRWIRLTVATVVSHGSLYLVLLLALRHVGVGTGDLSWITVLAAFAFVRLISALPITPGGVGVVELGYAAVLTIGAGETLHARIVAAILVFRAITYLLPIPLGAAAYVVWRTNGTWRLTVDERDRMATSGTVRGDDPDQPFRPPGG